MPGTVAERAVTMLRCPAGRWELARGAPNAALGGDVLEYRGYLETERLEGVWREVATSVVPLIVNLGSAFRVGLGGRTPERWTSFVAGPQDGFALVAPTGLSCCLQVDLTPLGAYRLLGIPMAAIADRVVSLDDLIGREADALAARLHGIGGWQERFALVDAWIAGRFARARAPSPAIRRGWTLLAASGGRLRTAELAGALGWSRKHLAARFREEVGQPPKTMARILRFERAEGMMAAGGAWADIAYACGYADQAHLSREFRALAGLAPTALARRPAAGNGLTEPG